jgi:TolB-like protein/DNA-binding winged helix-turn-helix (wHTH) protein
MPNPDPTSLLRFGFFEMDLRTAELRRAGRPVGLAPQPFKILTLLATHPGELVTREEIQRQIWGDETFVDFDQGLNFAIKKIRTALGDDADAPSYIETLPRRGYRFIAQVKCADAPSTNPLNATATGPPAHPEADGITRRAITTLVDAVIEHRRASQRWAAVGLGALGLAVLLILVLRFNPAGLRDRVLHLQSAGPIQSLAVLPFENLSSSKEQDYAADQLTGALIASLAKMMPGSLRVVSRTAVMPYHRAGKPLPQIARELNVDAVVEGTAARSAGRIRTTVQLRLAQDGRYLWGGAYERDLRDIEELEDDVARDLAAQIKARHRETGGR